ncbi:hypothetical protein B7P43_G08972 [Cryptotermes secundus]|uniref:G-protein coupled receptors family 1 profile domain-containing protein n=1 Tax=Cryptotermes secundus TaxID=105785 RepID=A0A2J7RC06_9NEOP|nr:hypothetical protein B7P43_G08972 [Cryptotermes secundus]
MTHSTHDQKPLAAEYGRILRLAALQYALREVRASYAFAYLSLAHSSSTHRRMRTVTNYFLVNLSVSDLLMSLLNCIFNFIFMLNSDWPFGAIYCIVNNFVANVTVAASVFTLVAISIDR